MVENMPMLRACERFPTSAVPRRTAGMRAHKKSQMITLWRMIGERAHSNMKNEPTGILGGRGRMGDICARTWTSHVTAPSSCNQGEGWGEGAFCLLAVPLKWHCRASEEPSPLPSP